MIKATGFLNGTTVSVLRSAKNLPFDFFWKVNCFAVSQEYSSITAFDQLSTSCNSRGSIFYPKWKEWTFNSFNKSHEDLLKSDNIVMRKRIKAEIKFVAWLLGWQIPLKNCENCSFLSPPACLCDPLQLRLSSKLFCARRFYRIYTLGCDDMLG